MSFEDGLNSAFEQATQPQNREAERARLVGRYEQARNQRILYPLSRFSATFRDQRRVDAELATELKARDGRTMGEKISDARAGFQERKKRTLPRARAIIFGSDTLKQMVERPAEPEPAPETPAAPLAPKPLARVNLEQFQPRKGFPQGVRQYGEIWALAPSADGPSASAQDQPRDIAAEAGLVDVHPDENPGQVVGYRVRFFYETPDEGQQPVQFKDGVFAVEPCLPPAEYSSGPEATSYTDQAFEHMATTAEETMAGLWRCASDPRLNPELAAIAAANNPPQPPQSPLPPQA